MASGRGSGRGTRGTATGMAPDAGRLSHRIGVRELRQHASVYIELVGRGYTVDVTNRGRLVARLVPAGGSGSRGGSGGIGEPDSPIERLFAAGLVWPAEQPGGLLGDGPPLPAPPGGPSASEILAGLREEERR